jgi:hypothetical protein
MREKKKAVDHHASDGVDTAALIALSSARCPDVDFIPVAFYIKRRRVARSDNFLFPLFP